MAATILHFCGRDAWSAAQADGEYRGDTLDTEGFIHCSTAAQVHVPANAIARGRTDLVLLEIDPDRLNVALRWEPGDPGDPGSMRFPHVYGPIPVGAVVAVHDFPPGSDGTLTAPPGLTHVLRTQDVDELRDWYERNHRTAGQLWLVMPSKASERTGVSYNDAVEVALCYGWIDSIRRRHDDESTVQRYSPRRRGSGYSQPNIERLRRLREQGRLLPEVAAAVAPVLARPFVFPDDILAAVEANPAAWANYTRFSPAYRRIRVAYIDAARDRPDEFAKRLAHFVAKCAQDKQIGYGGIDAYY